MNYEELYFTNLYQIYSQPTFMYNLSDLCWISLYVDGKSFWTWMSWAMMMIPHFLFDLRTAWIFTSKWGQLWKHQWMAKLCLHCGFLFHSSRRLFFIRWLVKKCADGRLLIYLHGRERPQTIANQQNSTAALSQYIKVISTHETQIVHKCKTSHLQSAVNCLNIILT